MPELIPKTFKCNLIIKITMKILTMISHIKTNSDPVHIQTQNEIKTNLFFFLLENEGLQQVGDAMGGGVGRVSKG